MKTIYFETDQFVRRKGNVIDLNEYRERMQRRSSAPAVGEPVGFQWQVDDSVWDAEEEEEETEVARPVRRHRRRRLSLADLLEACASGGALVLVITVWIQFLLL